MLRLCLTGLLLLTTGFAPLARASTLDAIREEVHTPRPTKKTRKTKAKRTRHHHHDHHVEDEAEAEAAFFALVALGYLVTAPWWAPHRLIDPHYPDLQYGRYPYADGMPGSMAADTDQGTWLVAHAAGGYGPNIARFNTGLRLLLLGRLELETEWTGLFEPQGQETDSLWLGKAQGMITFARTPRLQMRSGIGARFFVDGATDSLADDTLDSTAVGFNVAYGMDIFPVKPLVIRAYADLGLIKEAFVAEGLITVGAMWGPTEFFGGYHVLHIGNVTLHSGLAGVRAWL